MLLQLFLEATAYAQEEHEMGFTFAEIWAQSGFIARSVLILLAVMGLACIYVGVERLIAFNRARKQSMQLAAEIVGPLQQADVHGALEMAKDERFQAAYLADILSSGLAELDQRFDAHGQANAERAIDKAMVEEEGKLRRGFGILATTGATAPFVGLFGTVFGVINAFQGMAQAGSGLASVSAGIAEALIATGVGIGVAILGVWIFNYFNGRLEKVSDEMYASKADFIDWASKRILQRDEQMAKAGK